MSSIAARFRAALEEVGDPSPTGPELLPSLLARACARTLDVDGAGLSVRAAGQGRLPLGASSTTADLAERLQFTAGDGPCTAAERHREPVFAATADLQRRWPVFARLLTGQTPYRAVVALPIGETLAGPGALDLYFTDESAVTSLEVFEAMAVGDLVASALGDAAVWAPWAPEGGPAWLHGPAARRRQDVWTAAGRVAMARGTSPPAALELLRSAARATGRTVDDLAGDVVAGRVGPADLRPVGELPPAAGN
ncbi:ANTAR domain-containing protein [Geodermatophilus sp. DSM 44513]|uniref:ANTAR domain-containing protein n=1 Tax=Geodermatophilus sp. DSM 44513 TaxID=1528104 RepID=UPI00126FABF8|nr:ANTAR domain-containing protein [Geodermatophilus sp. DSM 44513]WNV76601.1 ANTAR domain-containing protein [Geodermatophilus sp. DSM 44513]